MNGVVYLHVGTKCLPRLIVSLSSLRDHFDGPVTVFNEGAPQELLLQIAEDLKVQICDLELNDDNCYVKKVGICQLVETDRTMFLDADTLVCSPLDQYFEWIEQAGLCFTNFCNWSTKGRLIGKRIRRWQELYSDLIETAIDYGTAINTGTFGFKKDHEFLKIWYDVAQAGQSAGIGLTDELAAQVLIPWYEHYLAPPDWGYSVKFGEREVGPLSMAKIIHYHGNKHLMGNGASDLWKAKFIELNEKYSIPTFGDKSLKKCIKSMNLAKIEPVKEEVEEGKEKWIDVLTTVIARATVESSIDCMLKKIDMTGFKVRWIVHLDKIDIFTEEQVTETRNQILELKERFDDFVFLEAEERRGHGGSLYELFSASEHDCLLWEDDKVCRGSASVKEFYDGGTDYVSLTSRRSKGICLTSPSFYRRKIIDHFLSIWDESFMTGDTEYMMISECKKMGFSFGGKKLRMRDIGVGRNSDLGVVRVRKELMGEAFYEKSDERVTFVTAVDKNYLQKLRNNIKAWRGHLNLDSFPVIVFYDGLEEEELNFLSPNCRLIKWDMDVETQREKMLSSFVLGTAQHVETDFWLKLDADAHFSKEESGRNPSIWDEDWFDYQIVGHKWGYTKPGLWLKTLDDWADGIEDFQGTERLFGDGKECSEQKKFGHPRFASYVCLNQTLFTKYVAGLCGDRLPVPSHDTVCWYVAERHPEFSWRGINMKKKCGLFP